MKEIVYLDFDLLFERVEEKYAVRVINSPAGQAVAEFSLPFSELEFENFLLRIGRPRRVVRRTKTPEMEAAKSLGGKLFEAVFNEEVRGCLRSSLDEAYRREAGLRILLRLAQTPELADLPWEYLYNPTLNRFLCLSVETPIVRYLDLPERIRPLVVKPPLRILTMFSNPKDLTKLDVEREYEILKASLSKLEQRGLVTLELLENATLSALQKKLRRGEYHIFHFMGHGGFDKQAQDGMLIFEDENQRGRAIYGEDLGMLMHDHRPLRLVILNSCEGSRTSRSDPFSGTAQSLVQQGIAAVIAMQFEITDEAALSFAEDFYGALADGHPADAALTEARKAIYSQGLHMEWGTPVLYMRSPDGRIFDVEQISIEERISSEKSSEIELTDKLEKEVNDAEIYLRKGEFERALEGYNAVLEHDPKNKKALVGLEMVKKALSDKAEIDRLIAEGKSHLQNKAYNKALASFNDALEYDPTNEMVRDLIEECKELHQIDHLLSAGKKYFENRQYKKALARLRQVIDLDPNHEEAKNLIAVIQKKIKEWEKVNKLLLDAESYLEQNKFEQAIEIYQEVLTLDSQNQTALKFLPQTQKELDRLTKIDKSVSQGKSYLKENQYSDALACFKAAVKLDCNNQEVLNLITTCENKLKEIQQIDKLLAQGKRYLNRGTHTKALTTLNRVLDLDSNHSEAKALINEAQRKIEQLEQVTNLFNEAESYFKNSKYEQAIEKYNRILEIDPQNKKALSQLRQAEKASAVVATKGDGIAIPVSKKPVKAMVKELFFSRRGAIFSALGILALLIILLQNVILEKKPVEQVMEVTPPPSMAIAQKQMADAKTQAEKNQASIYAPDMFKSATSMAADAVNTADASNYQLADSLFAVARDEFINASQIAEQTLAALENAAKSVRTDAVTLQNEALKNNARDVPSYNSAVKLLASGDQYLKENNYKRAKSQFNTAQERFRAAIKEAIDLKKQAAAVKLLKEDAILARDRAGSLRLTAEQNNVREYAKEAFEYAATAESNAQKLFGEGNYSDAISTFIDAESGYTRAIDEKRTWLNAQKFYQAGEYQKSLDELSTIFIAPPYKRENNRARQLYNDVTMAEQFRQQKINAAQTAADNGDLRTALGLVGTLPERDQKTAEVAALQTKIISLDKIQPIISHIKDKNYTPNKPILLRVRAEDDLYVSQVWVHYKRKDAKEFIKKEMIAEPNERGMYSFSIPAEYPNYREVRYYFTAKDISGNEGKLGSTRKLYKLKSSEKLVVPQIP